MACRHHHVRQPPSTPTSLRRIRNRLRMTPSRPSADETTPSAAAAATDEAASLAAAHYGMEVAAAPASPAMEVPESTPSSPNTRTQTQEILGFLRLSTDLLQGDHTPHHPTVTPHRTHSHQCSNGSSAKASSAHSRSAKAWYCSSGQRRWWWWRLTLILLVCALTSKGCCAASKRIPSKIDTGMTVSGSVMDPADVQLQQQRTDYYAEEEDRKEEEVKEKMDKIRRNGVHPMDNGESGGRWAQNGSRHQSATNNSEKPRPHGRRTRPTGRRQDSDPSSLLMRRQFTAMNRHRHSGQQQQRLPHPKDLLSFDLPPDPPPTPDWDDDDDDASPSGTALMVKRPLPDGLRSEPRDPLKSSKDALFVTKKKYLKKDWCKTEPLTQKVQEPGCLTRTIVNRFCYGQCNSFYIPKNARMDLETTAFKSCAFCQPKRFRWITITLRCPGRTPPYKRKRIKRIKKCKCIGQQ